MHTFEDFLVEASNSLTNEDISDTIKQALNLNNVSIDNVKIYRLNHSIHMEYCFSFTSTMKVAQVQPYLAQYGIISSEVLADVQSAHLGVYRLDPKIWESAASMKLVELLKSS